VDLTVVVVGQTLAIIMHIFPRGGRAACPAYLGLGFLPTFPFRVAACNIVNHISIRYLYIYI